MSLADTAPETLRTLVAFIEARLKDREPEDDPMGVFLLNSLGLLISDASSERNAVRAQWAVECLTDLAYLFADHADYRPQWLPLAPQHRQDIT